MDRLYRVALRTEGVDRNLDIEIDRLVALVSPSARRAWIEIPSGIAGYTARTGSPSARRAWIEITEICPPCCWTDMSPSARRAWIEIAYQANSTAPDGVVALRTEGVDRNFARRCCSGGQGPVALRTEGVDRNGIGGRIAGAATASPSARRAWIEIYRFFRRRYRVQGRPPHGGRG